MLESIYDSQFAVQSEDAVRLTLGLPEGCQLATRADAPLVLEFVRMAGAEEGAGAGAAYPLVPPLVCVSCSGLAAGALRHLTRVIARVGRGRTARVRSRAWLTCSGSRTVVCDRAALGQCPAICPPLSAPLLVMCSNPAWSKLNPVPGVNRASLAAMSVMCTVSPLPAVHCSDPNDGLPVMCLTVTPPCRKPPRCWASPCCTT